MKVLLTKGSSKGCDAMAQALVIYPTDTVYALGCLSTQPKALKQLAKIKGVKLEKAPFSFFFQNISVLSQYVTHFDAPIYRLINKALPGPYTFIFKGGKKLPKPFDKRKDIGARISSHPILKVLVELLEAPLVTTSLHHKDKVIEYTTDPDQIYENWADRVDIIIDAGAGEMSSTAIDLTQFSPEIVRLGLGFGSIKKAPVFTDAFKRSKRNSLFLRSIYRLLIPFSYIKLI